jgi:ABC-type protease/lipase transport system fused ATPase/permease subunit
VYETTSLLMHVMMLTSTLTSMHVTMLTSTLTSMHVTTRQMQGHEQHHRQRRRRRRQLDGVDAHGCRHELRRRWRPLLTSQLSQ